MLLLDRIPAGGLPEGVEAWTVVDEDPDTSFLEQPCFAARQNEFIRGLFAFVGIVARRRCPTCRCAFRRLGALLAALALASCAPCHPNHSGVCEGPPITPAEERELLEIIEELRARADTSTALDLGG